MSSELIDTLLHRLSDRLLPPPHNSSHHPHNTEGGGEEEGYWLEAPLIEPLSTLLLRLSGEFPLLEKFLETINIRLDVLQQETELLKEEVELGEASVHELEQQLLVEQQLMQEETHRLEGIKRDLEQENEELKSQQRITVEKLKRQLIEQAEKLEDEMTWVNEKRREAEQEVEWCQQELALAKRQVTTLQRQYLDSMKENDRLLLSLKAPPSPKSLHPVLTKGLVSLSSASSIHSHFIRAPSPGLTLPDSPPPPPPFSDSSDKMSDKMSDFTQEEVPGTPNTLNPSNISSSEKVLFQHDDEDSDLTWLQTANLQLCKMIEQSNDELNRTLRHLTEWRTRCAMLTQENEEMKQKITSRMSLLTLFSPSS